MPKLLAIETSCDECSASVVERTERFAVARSNVIFSQIELHRRFGGVVPEVASRNHLEMISPVIDEALEKAGVRFAELDAIAVTQNPGLIGALLVGVSAAKSIAYALDKPLVPVNHLQGHLHSIFLDGQKGTAGLTRSHLPLIACLVSGGHTNLYLIRDLPPARLNVEKLSESRDDAAGEAFDKCAKLLGLPYPGGVHLDRASRGGNPGAYDFPRALPGKESLEFSFSGLKTAVSTKLKAMGFEPHGIGQAWGTAPDPTKLPQGQVAADLCASIQEAIVQTLVRKIKIAISQTGARGLAIVGGVSANSRLRELVAGEIALKASGDHVGQAPSAQSRAPDRAPSRRSPRVDVFVPDQQYCTDNAAMIGAAALFALERGEALTGREMLALNASSSE